MNQGKVDTSKSNVALNLNLTEGIRNLRRAGDCKSLSKQKCDRSYKSGYKECWWNDANNQCQYYEDLKMAAPGFEPMTSTVETVKLRDTSKRGKEWCNQLPQKRCKSASKDDCFWDVGNKMCEYKPSSSLSSSNLSSSKLPSSSLSSSSLSSSSPSKRRLTSPLGKKSYSKSPLGKRSHSPYTSKKSPGRRNILYKSPMSSCRARSRSRHRISRHRNPYHNRMSSMVL